MNPESPMRISTVCLLLCLALAACGREDPPVEPAARTPATAPEDAIAQAADAAADAAAAAADAAAPSSARAALDAWIAAWNAHDTTKLGLMLADDVEYFDAGFAGLQHGRDAALDQGVWAFLRGVPDLHWELRGEPVAGTDSIAWEWTFTGTHTGTWGGVRPTRQRVNLKGVSVMRLRNGKITHVATYYDSAALNRQLGL